MCKKWLIKFKYIINAVYMIVVLFLMEMVGQMPFIQTAFAIENGTFADKFVNWGVAIVVYVVTISILVSLVINARNFSKKAKLETTGSKGTKLVFKEIDPKTRTTSKKFCSIFNPLC